MKISAFTLAYNPINAGLPIVEAVQAVQPYVDEVLAVNVGSTDGTRKVLQKLGCRIFDLPKPNQGEGDPALCEAFGLHTQAKGDLILFFEADEVYDDKLLNEMRWVMERGHTDIGCYRIQVEGNFQRIRWYPHAVHRVFRPGTVQYYPPPPVECPPHVHLLPIEAGLLWDCSNVFRDQWHIRKQQQQHLWTHNRRLMVGEHFTFPNEVDEAEEERRLGEPHWGFSGTPLAIPAGLRPLLGVRDYRESEGVKVLLGGEG